MNEALIIALLAVSFAFTVLLLVLANGRVVSLQEREEHLESLMAGDEEYIRALVSENHALRNEAMRKGGALLYLTEKVENTHWAGVEPAPWREEVRMARSVLEESGSATRIKHEQENAPWQR
jgi:predicted RecB family endonuclease